MLRFVWILLLLAAAGWLACEIPSSPAPKATQSQRDLWRRTSRGWERADWLLPEVPARRRALHPGVVGLLELFVSVAALIAFPARLGRRRAQQRDERRGQVRRGQGSGFRVQDSASEPVGPHGGSRSAGRAVRPPMAADH